MAAAAASSSAARASGSVHRRDALAGAPSGPLRPNTHSRQPRAKAVAASGPREESEATYIVGMISSVSKDM